MGAVFWKELTDNFGRRRFVIILGLILFSAMWAAYVAVQSLRGLTVDVPPDLIFLRLFTGGTDVLPPFLFFLSFFSPLIGITLGFDAVNSERSEGTLARVLSQPLHRDALFNGKFLAGLATIAIIQVSITLIVVGLGMYILGFGPTAAASVRIAAFTLATIVYMGFWLAIAMLCSVWLNRAVSSAMTSLALWLFFGFIMLLLAGVVADVIVGQDASQEAQIDRVQVQALVQRFSPVTLFQEASDTLLNPTQRALGPVLSRQVQGLQVLKPLPVSQSVLLVWPHLVAMVALAGICFGVSYVRFLREEIRP